MTNRTADSTERLGLHSLLVSMSEEYIEGAAGRVLGHLARASPESRRAFRTELDKLNLPVPGFRNASVALRSNPQRLEGPIRNALMHSDDLAGATLRVWAESHQSLCDSISERLNDIGAYIGVSADYPDSDENQLRGHWSKDAWESEKERFAGLHNDADENDIELMMCYVCGLLPGTADADDEQVSVSEAVEQIPDALKLLGLSAVDLENLPVSAPEWESDIPELVDRIAVIVGAKREERSRAATLDTFIASMVDDFSAELSYLESDISTWSADMLPESNDVSGALGMCEELRLTLAELRAVRKSVPGATRSAERERRNRNDELEDQSLGALHGIGRLMSGEPLIDDDPPSRSARSIEQAEYVGAPDVNASTQNQTLDAFPVFESEQLYRENLSLQSERDELKGENERLRVKVRRLEAKNRGLDGEIESLRSESRTLKNDVQFIRADKAEIEGKLESLRSELTDKASEVETWRQAYEDESQIPRLTVEDVPQQIEHVSDAVAYARVMFKDTILLKLNSKSEVRDNPFVKPQDVWDALQWLATAYHGARAGLTGIPDFDVSLRETCGWQYRSGQGQTTLNKYREWYTTKANGKTYRLAEHLAKGASKDARHTIRIAFDWDRDDRVVVVGYIGQHQETDAT